MVEWTVYAISSFPAFNCCCLEIILLYRKSSLKVVDWVERRNDYYVILHWWKHAKVALGRFNLLAKVPPRLYTFVSGRTRQLTMRHIHVAILNVGCLYVCVFLREKREKNFFELNFLIPKWIMRSEKNEKKKLSFNRKVPISRACRAC